MKRLHDFPIGRYRDFFQSEANRRRIFVNLPTQQAISVIDQTTDADLRLQFHHNRRVDVTSLPSRHVGE